MCPLYEQARTTARSELLETIYLVEEARRKFHSQTGICPGFWFWAITSPGVGAKSPQGLLQLPGGLCVTRTSLEGITCSSDGLSGMPCPGNDGAGLPVAPPGGDSGEEVESIGGSGPSMFPDGTTSRTKCHLGLPPPTLSFGISALSPS